MFCWPNLTGGFFARMRMGEDLYHSMPPQIAVSVDKWKTNVFGPNSTSARQFVAEGQIDPKVKLFGNMVALKRGAMPFYEVLGAVVAPSRKFQVREIGV